MLRFSRAAGQPSPIVLADRAREARQWDLAARHYRTALARNPHNPPIWVQYGHALKEGGSYAAAEAAYRRAIADDPTVADTYLQLGRVLKLQARTEEAKAAYLRGFSMDQSLYEAAGELAEIGCSAEDLPQLLRDIPAPVAGRHKAGPAAGSGRMRWRESAITRADRARDLAQWETAARLYRQALDRNPGNPPIWVQYGHVLKQSGRLRDAEEAYRQALAYDGRLTDAHLALGRLLKLRGETEAAQQVFLRAFALDSSMSDVLPELAGLGWPDVRLAALKGLVSTNGSDTPFREARSGVDLVGEREIANGSGDEPFDLLQRFIGFDRDFYEETNPHLKNSGTDPWRHFVEHGRFDSLRVRPLEPAKLLAAVGFDVEYYYSNNQDVVNAKNDLSRHFLSYGLREGRLPCAPRPNPDEADFWEQVAGSHESINSSNEIAFLPLASKLSIIIRTSVEQLSPIVCDFLTKSRVSYFKEDLAVLLAQAALQLRWVTVAESYLSAYHEGLPFTLPNEMAPRRTAHVYRVMTPHEYCDSRGINFVTFKTSRKSLESNARFVPQGRTGLVFSATDLPPVVGMELKDATVVGGTGAIITNDNILLSSEVKESCIDQSIIFKSSSYLIGGPRHVAVYADRVPTRLSARALSLLHDYDTNYFHFLVEILPKFIAVVDLMGSPGSQADSGAMINDLEKVIVRSGLPASVHQIIAELATLPRPLSGLIHEVDSFARVKVSRLWLVSDFHRFLIRDSAPRMYDRAFCGETLRALRARLTELEWAAAIEAMFVQRRNTSVRQLCNRAQVEQAFGQIGFRLFDPGAAEFAVQRREFRGSSLIVGESGAAMTNLLFCHPGTVAVLLTNDNRYQDFISFAALATAAGIELYYYPGMEAPGPQVREVDNDFFVDPADVVREVLGISGVEENAIVPAILDRMVRKAWIEASAQFEAGEVDRALESIAAAASAAAARSDTVGVLSGSDVLDGLTLKIGSRAVNKVAVRDADRLVGGTARTAYIATELYMIGGHARVLEDVIAALPEEEHHVILTDHNNREIPFNEILRVEKDIRVIPHFLSGTAGRKLETGIQILRRLQPAALFHFAHPSDATALAMMQPELAGRRAIFHHNDHTFALGRHVAGAIHVGFHQRFNEQARGLWGLETALLPLSCRDEIEAPEICQGPLTTLTSGAGGKFETALGRSYLDLLRTRLGAREGNHIHVGNLSHQQRAEIDALLTSHGWADRFIHIPIVRRLAQALRILKPHLYLSSYPVGGGKATVEAMACGIPVCAAKGSILDGISIGYPEMFIWNNLREFYDILMQFDKECYQKHQNLAFTHFQRFHSFSEFVRCARSIRYGYR